MAKLPDANYIIHRPEIRGAFVIAKGQAMDQAKAAFKNNYCFNPRHSIHWMLVVGPYWTPVKLGPFSQAELTVRSHKKSDSEDLAARLKLEVLQSEYFELGELYCFNSTSSYDHIEGILRETDVVAQPFINGILGRLDRV